MATTPRFQDSSQRIYIEDSLGNRFECPSEEFPRYAEGYKPVPPNTVRVWTPAVQYLSDGNQQPDAFYTADRFAAYVANLAVYQAAYDAAHADPPAPVLPCVYAFVNLDKREVKGDDTDAIPISVKVTAADDPAAAAVPLTHAWGIHLFNVKTSEEDVILVQLTNGLGSKLYTIAQGYGRWRVYEKDFDQITVGGQAYQIKLRLSIAGVALDQDYIEITVYRK